MSIERRVRGENVLSLLEWTVDDVLSWLKSLRLSQDYSPLFREYHIDGLFLSKITPNFIDTNLSIITTSDRSILIQSISNLRIHQLTTALPRLPINEHSIPTPPLSGNDTTVATPTGGMRVGGVTTGGGGHSKSKSFDDLINDYQAPPSATPTTNSIHGSSSHHVLKSLTPVPHSQVVSTHLLDIMKEENSDLKKELDYYYKRVCRLQKFEQELESLQEAHRSMVASTARKEKLELIMRQKLEEELKEYRESNAQYEVQIATVKRNASLKNTKPDNVMRKEIARKDSIIARLIKQNQDGVLMRERLEKDLHHMRHTTVPATATSEEEEEEEEEEENGGLTNDTKITDENDKLVSNYAKSIETLRSIFNGMTSSYNKQMNIEGKLRRQLETKIHEIEEKKGGERGRGGGAEDLNLLNAKLEADKAKLEHKVIELMAERQLLEDSISIPKDAMIRRLERQLQEKENEIKILKEQKSTYTKQLETNEETIEEYKTKVSLLVSSLSDKDMLLKTLQSLLEPDETPTHQSLSYPRKTSLDTLNERGGGTGGDIAPVGPIRKTSSPVYPTTTHESVSYKQLEPSLPTYDQHMLGVIGPVVLYNQPPTNQPTLPHSLPHSVHPTTNTGNGLSINNHLLANSLSVPGGGGAIKRGVTGGGSRSFPNTPEIHRRVKEGGASVGEGVATGDRFYNKSLVISAPSSHQNSPLLRHKPRPFTKSLTPPPHQLPYISSQVGVAGRHMIKVHDDVSDNSSIDSLLSPSSPVNNKQWTNRKNKSLINYINREAGHSQDSGVLVELCGHI